MNSAHNSPRRISLFSLSSVLAACILKAASMRWTMTGKNSRRTGLVSAAAALTNSAAADMADTRKLDSDASWRSVAASSACKSGTMACESALEGRTSGVRHP